MSKQNQKVGVRQDESPNYNLAQTVTSPECLSASVLTICQDIERSQIREMISELKRQTAAVHMDDLSRAQSMLIAQAHTLDGLFADSTPFGHSAHADPDTCSTLIRTGSRSAATQGWHC